MSYTENRFKAKGVTLTDSVLDSTLARSNFVRITTTSAQNTITVKDNNKNILGSILLYTAGDTIIIDKNVTDRISTSGTAVCSSTNWVPADQTVKNYCDNSEKIESWTQNSTTTGINATETTLAANINATQNYIPVASTTNFSTSVVAEIDGNEVVSFSDISSNVFPYSQDLDNAYWGKARSTVTADQAVAPDGTTTADLVTQVTSTQAGAIYKNSYSPLTNGAVYTYSAHAKYVTGSDIKFLRLQDYSMTGGGVMNQTYFNIETGAIGTSDSDHTAVSTDVGNGWFRFTITVTSGNTGGNFAFYRVNEDGGGIATQNDTYLMWGLQLEIASVATPYLPTTSAALAGLTNVTRGVNGTTAASASSGDTVGTGKYIAPDGTATADLVIPNATAGYRSVRADWTGMLHNDHCIGSFYAKASGNINTVFPNFAGAAAGNRWKFTLTGAGTVAQDYIASQGAGTYWGQIDKIGTDGWYRCQIGGVTSTGNTNTRYLDIMPGGTDGTINGAANGTSGILVWGTQIEIVSNATDRAGMYVKTETVVPGVGIFEGEEVSITGI
tara:strand:+ start:61 stop:1728 length:1668 start_codon:yes stop_codon:yes gene_type:complete